MNKQFIAVLVVVVAALFGIFALASKSSDNNGPAVTGEPSNHVVGEGKKNVTLTEYGDFECPACKQYYPLVQQVKQDYGDDITFQFRHFPLVQIHPNAFLAARAAEAAGLQGKFFEMHDLLYENQDSWKSAPNVNAVFEGYAQQLGLDVAKFKTDAASEQANATINADIKAGQAIGANSTPTFVLNGQKIENPTTPEDFKKVIDEAIAAANQNQ